MKKLCPRKDASLSGVPTQVGTSNCRKFRCMSGLSGSLKKSAQVSGVIPTLGVPTKVGSSDCREFRPKSGLPTQVRTSDIPNRKSCSDLAFWIPIQTVPNSWETWKIRLGEVSYWDKTTSSLYMRGLWPIEFSSIQSTQKHNKSIYYIFLPSFSNLPLLLVLCRCCMARGSTTTML